MRERGALMRQGKGIIVVFAAFYVAIAALCLVPLFAAGGLSDRSFGIAFVTAVALIPLTAIILNMILEVRERHRRRPRPPIVDRSVIPPPPASREQFEFAFAAWNGIDSAEAVQRLSARLTAIGIAHRFDGTIAVEDGDVSWRVGPVHGALRIAGWVVADDADARAMVQAAIEEFLIDELGISLERLAA